MRETCWNCDHREGEFCSNKRSEYYGQQASRGHWCSVWKETTRPPGLYGMGLAPAKTRNVGSGKSPKALDEDLDVIHGGKRDDDPS